MTSYPRDLSVRERAALDHLLAAEFPGVEARREQGRSLRVRGLYKDLPTVVLLQVTDPAAPRADTPTVPVEARVVGADPPQELLLFVKDGLIESLELVLYGDPDPRELPALHVLGPPKASERAS